MIQRWVDGALPVDMWPELRLPEKLRAAWAPTVQAAAAGRAYGVFEYEA